MLLWRAKCILISLCLLSNSYMSQASSFRTFFLHKFPTSANNITAILKYDYHLISATSQACTYGKQSLAGNAVQRENHVTYLLC